MVPTLQMNSTGLIRYSNRMLGLVLLLDKHHFQSDLKFKCVSTFTKQIAHSSDQVTFATQNAELLRSSVAPSSSRPAAQINRFGLLLLLIKSIRWLLTEALEHPFHII